MVQLWLNGPRYEDDPTFKLSTDSILLSNFSKDISAERCMDLGCGGGLISVLLNYSNPNTEYDSIDIREEAVDICKINYRNNKVQGNIFCGDMRNHRELGDSGQYDLVVCNPPYFYGSKPSPNENRATAREGNLSPAQFCGAASFLLKKGASFCLVHKPDYLADIFAAMRLGDIEPKRIRFVSHKVTSKPSLVLIEGRRSGRPGLTAMPLLVLANDDGSPTKEMKEIYHRI